MLYNNYFVEHLVVPSVAEFFLLVGIVGVAVGVGLVVWNAPTLRLLAALNRWVSTRRWLKAVEVPHDTSSSVQRYRIEIGVFFVLAAAYSLYGLVGRFNVLALVPANSLGSWRPAAVWLIDSIRWFLVVSSIAAAAVGILMVLFPGKLRNLEMRANEWHSLRRALGGTADTMYMPLDKWVEHYPRVAGLIIAAGAFGVTVGSVMVLERLR
jgi:hypothetical protein